MLLRRITKHVSDQNWFAVFIDFLIVVVGVFIGIQIGDWNNDRLKSERTEVLYERLADDFGVDVWLAEHFSSYNKDVIKNAKLVLDDLTKRQLLDDNKLLIAAFRATQFNRMQKSSTYKELVSTGGYDLLAKSKLGRIATVFYENETANEIQSDGQYSDYRSMYRTLVPIDVQLHIATACGDRDFSIERLMNIESVLSYECELSLTENQISEAAFLLRGDPELAKNLRRRIANLSMQNIDFGTLLEAIKPYRASKEVMSNAGVFMIYRKD